MTSVIRRRDIHRGKRPREDTQEMRVMLPQVKECLETPEAGGGKEVSSPNAFRGNSALLTL